MKKVIKILTLVSLFFITSFAANYSYSRMTININVLEENIFEVEEILSVDFSSRSHGIIRNIPFRSKIYRADLPVHNQINRIADVRVNNVFTTTEENGSLFIKIGDPNAFVSAHEIYKITYKIYMGRDGTRNFDELYYNLIGTDFDTTIDNFSFNITMPKSFDKSKVGFSLGKQGSAGYDQKALSYQIDGNRIFGKLNVKLAPYNALTIRLELPEGYFKDRNTERSIIIMIVSFGLIVFLGIVMNKNTGMKPAEPVEFYPPFKELSAPRHAGYLGKINYSDVNASIFELANGGYIFISDKKEDLVKKSDQYIIKKIKDYDGDNKDLRKIFDLLFSKGDEVTGKQISNSSKYYKKLNAISEDINNKREYNLHPKDYSKWQTIAFIVTAIIIFLNYIVVIGDYLSPIKVIIISIFAGALPAIMTSFKNKTTSLTLGSLVVVAAVDLIIYFLNIMVLPSILLYVLVIIKGIINLKPDLYTEDMGRKIGRVRGFRSFLITAEKDKLEALVEENPNYFMDILPYTMAFGISNVWVKKFRQFNIAMETPYINTNNYYYLGRATAKSFKSSYNNYQESQMSSGSSFSGGGGFSGGGFAGGGSGGGGSSSW